jgi:hypothetical protein
MHNEHVGCLDFSVDENGLWLIYRNGSRNFIYAALLSSIDLSVQKRVKIELFPTQTFSQNDNRNSNGALTIVKSRNKKSIANNQAKAQQILAPHSLDYDDLLNGFVLCGKIYFLQYHYLHNTTIRYVFDLYDTNKFNYLKSIQFLQPFNRNTQLTYNPFDQRLYAWDSNHLLTYHTGLTEDDN